MDVQFQKQSSALNTGPSESNLLVYAAKIEVDGTRAMQEVARAIFTGDDYFYECWGECSGDPAYQVKVLMLNSANLQASAGREALISSLGEVLLQMSFSDIQPNEYTLKKSKSEIYARFESWAQSVTDLFNSKPHPPHSMNLLQYPEQRQLAFDLVQRFVDEALKFPEIAPAMHCAGDLVKNLANNVFFRKDRSDDGFEFKPEVLCSQEFKALVHKEQPDQALYSARRRVEMAYLNNCSEVEMMAELLLDDYTELFWGQPFEDYLAQLSQLEAHGYPAHKALKSYPDLRHLDIPLAEIEKQWPELLPKIMKRGIFVDVDLTLLEHDWKTEDDKFNLELYQALLDAKTAGISITIFTGGNPPDAESRLLDKGVDYSFLPVRSKHDFRGLFLETSVDDSTTTNYVVVDYIEVDGNEAAALRQRFCM